MKISFKRKCEKFYIGKNKRLYEIRNIKNQFDKKSYLINSIILTEEEAIKIIKLFHKELMHIGINALSFEIERRGIYI